MVERERLIKAGLTEADWDGEAPSPGSSDRRYSKEAKKGFQSISDRVAAQIRDGDKIELLIKSAEGEDYIVEVKPLL